MFSKAGLARLVPVVVLVSMPAVGGAAVLGRQTQAQPSAETQTAPSDAVLEQFKGARLGMSIDEVRQILGKPDEKDDGMDMFFVSNKRRIRVYYDSEHKARALVSSFLGNDSGAPTPEAVLGISLEPREDGSMSGTVRRPEAGYTLVYSRVGGDDPMVLITLQKS